MIYYLLGFLSSTTIILATYLIFVFKNKKEKVSDFQNIDKKNFSNDIDRNDWYK